MNKRAAALLVVGGSIVIWPLDAQAQKIPWIVLPLAFSPVVAVLLSVGLAAATRSWIVGGGNISLVVVWVAWFVAASKYSTSDLVVWAPIMGLGLHLIAMIWLLALHAVRRRRARNEA